MLNDRLKKYSDTNAINATYATPDPSNTLEVARVAGVQVAAPAQSEVISNWWLLHFVDLDPVKVAIWPPCNYAGVLEPHPDVIAAEPLPPQVLDVANEKIIED